MTIRVDELYWPKYQRLRILSALQHNGIKTVGDLLKIDDIHELLMYRNNLGPRSMATIVETIRKLRGD